MAEDSKDAGQRLPPGSIHPFDRPALFSQVTGSAVPKPEGLTPEEEEKFNAVRDMLSDAFTEDTMKELVELLKTEKGKDMSADELLAVVFRF